MMLKHLLPPALLAWSRLLRNRFRYRDCDIQAELIGRAVSLGRGTRISRNVELGDGVSIGDHSYVNAGSVISNASIGKYCSIAYYCHIGAQKHSINGLSSSPWVRRRLGHSPCCQGPAAVIGHDVWIGTHAVVMPGVTVGHGAVIGSGSIVTRDIPPYAVAAGAPTRILRYRFDDVVISELMSSEWWNMPESTWSDVERAVIMRHVAEPQAIKSNVRVPGPHGNPKQ